MNKVWRTHTLNFCMLHVWQKLWLRSVGYIPESIFTVCNCPSRKFSNDIHLNDIYRSTSSWSKWLFVLCRPRKNYVNDGVGLDQRGLPGYNYRVSCREKLAIQDVSTQIKKKKNWQVFIVNFFLKLTEFSLILPATHT